MAKTKTVHLIEATLNDFVAHLRPADPEILKLLDFGWEKEKLGYNIFEIRPHHFPEMLKEGDAKFFTSPFARIRYYKNREEFELYWRRANDTWHFYQPNGIATHLDALIRVIKEDTHGCFFG